jgi:hypothetical protein
MRMVLRGVWLLGVLATLGGCSCNSNSQDPNKPGGSDGSGSTSVEHGVVKGLVVDKQGKPMAGLKVVVENTVFYAQYLYGTTGQDGSYRVEVPNGGWKVSIQLDRDFQGHTYRYDLAPDVATEFTGTDGAVRNFTWRLKGARPDQPDRFYGATLNLYRAPGFEVYYDFKDVEITATPVGPLIDGSTGQTVVARGESSADRIRDIPVGQYTFTARYVPDGQPAKPMKIRVRNVGDLQDSVTAVFNTPQPGLAIHELDLELDLQ